MFGYAGIYLKFAFLTEVKYYRNATFLRFASRMPSKKKYKHRNAFLGFRRKRKNRNATFLRFASKRHFLLQIFFSRKNSNLSLVFSIYNSTKLFY